MRQAVRVVALQMATSQQNTRAKDRVMEINLKDNKITCQFDYDPETVGLVNKNGLGMRFDARSKTWHHPATYTFIKALAETFPAHTPDHILQMLGGNTNQSGWEPSPFLMDHQKSGARLALDESRHGFFYETGTGKTLLALEIVRQKGLKTLVVCPLSIIENAWVEDAKKFYPDFNIANLWDLARKKTTKFGKVRYAKGLKECDIGVINFDRFRTMSAELHKAGFEMLIVDESSKVKSPKSKITKELIKYADTVPYVYLFSGTPAPNSELEYYSQVRMLDQAILSKSFYNFRASYFMQSGYGGFKWKINPVRKQEFLDKLATVSSVIKKDDVLDLPGKTINIRKVFLTPKEMSAYKEMEAHMLLEIEDQESVAANAAVKCMKLREGSSGFFIDDNGGIIETGKSKLNELISLLEDIGDHPVIIWTNFHYEAGQITDVLEKLGKTFARADGTVNQDRKNQAIRDFKSGKVQYFIGHPASVGHGITLTNCSYMVYFSLSYSFELQSQSADRIYRKGQENHCSYYYLLADGTIDFAIMKAVDVKQTLTEMVFDFIKTKRRKKGEK